jgi:hypothetical protein
VNNPSLVQEQATIDKLLTDVKNFSGDPSVQALLTYYACIRVSGFIENCVRTIFGDYAIPRSKDHVQAFVNEKLRKFPNPTWDAIVKLTRDFDKQWATNLKSRVARQHLDSLESINTNRNAIAHGGVSSLTIHQLLLYYSDVVVLIEELENCCQ